MDDRLQSIIAHHRAARAEMEAADAELEALVAEAIAPKAPEPTTYPKSMARGAEFEETARNIIEGDGDCFALYCFSCPFSWSTSGLRCDCVTVGFTSGVGAVASALRYLAEVAEEREHLKAMVKVTEALK